MLVCLDDLHWADPPTLQLLLHFARKLDDVWAHTLDRIKESHAEIEPPITVRSLSEAIGVRANDLIRRMMNSMGQMVTINASLDDDSAMMLALEFGVELQVVHERTAEDDLLEEFDSRSKDEEAGNLVERPPIIEAATVRADTLPTPQDDYGTSP